METTWPSNSVQLTVALTAGLGCGIVIGVLLASRKRPSLPSAGKESVLSFDNVSGEYKMVFVVRNDLKMGKGKVAAQCGHAAIGAYQDMKRTNPELLKRWESMGCMKVVVKAPDELIFHKVSADARKLGLSTHIVRDAGRTQIAPGSKTVLCVGPGTAKEVDLVTGNLKLY